MLPTDFSPVSTAQYAFYRLRNEDMVDVINEALVMATRVVDGGDVEPAAGNKVTQLRTLC